MAGLVKNRIAVLVAAGFEDSELVKPVEALREAGADVTLIGLSEADKQGVKGKKGTVVSVDEVIDAVSEQDFDVLVIPGGKGPALLRKNERVLQFTRDFDSGNKTIAAICHGPQVLASADLLEGKTATSYYKVAPEVKRAGGIFVNEPVVVDGNLITSRHPGDIPMFINAIFKDIGVPPEVAAAVAEA